MALARLDIDFSVFATEGIVASAKSIVAFGSGTAGACWALYDGLNAMEELITINNAIAANDKRYGGFKMDLMVTYNNLVLDRVLRDCRTCSVGQSVS